MYKYVTCSLGYVTRSDVMISVINAVNGSVKRVVFGHDWSYRNCKICNYCVMFR